MQYLLTKTEFEEMHKAAEEAKELETYKDIVHDLRSKVMELGEFRCFHDLKDGDETYVDDGYCDKCPLSFCSNEGKKLKYRICGRTDRLYSK